jgi:SanA protein
MVLILVLLGVGVVVVFAPLALRQWAAGRYAGRIYRQVAEVPASPVAIVFGAGYWPSGRLSNALADRMKTAIALYEMGTVNKLLLTGDNRVDDYNEPEAMAEYALARGVPRDDLVLDYAGRRTYDSCYRAGAIFGVERAILVTQAFHLPRAIYTCEQLGLAAVGVAADQRGYRRALWYEVREVAALSRAWLDVNLFRPQPVLGEPILVDWTRRSGGAQGN